MSETNKSAVVSFKDVDIVFGEKPHTALPMIDAGKTRQEIQAETARSSVSPVRPSTSTKAKSSC